MSRHEPIRSLRHNRRRFLKHALRLALGTAAGCGLYAWRIEPRWIEVVRRRMEIPNLETILDGATLVQISDLHVGERVSDELIQKAFAAVRSLAPDFVAVTGDWISYEAAGADHLHDLMSQFPCGRLGTVGILGNHDFGPGWHQTHVADRVALVAQDAGVRVLRNETAVVGGLQFLGIGDLWSPEFHPAKAVESFDRGAAALALCHNPDACDLPVWSDFNGWILAGHTHGGQCRPPFLPPPILPVRNRRYTAGEFALEGGRRLYINRGIGHLLRVRFNVRPEITQFTLARN